MHHETLLLLREAGRGRVRRVAAVAAVVAFAALGAPPVPARADHDPFPVSSGVYRIPYADGTGMSVTRDHHTHAPVENRIDMAAGTGSEIVASASGWIAAVVDYNGNSPNPGDGVDKDGNPQDDSLEHSCQDDQDAEGNAIPDSVVAGLCQHYNNYVWIEHPNGEWTKYSHFGTGTVTERGWQEGMWIDAGEVLGLEGDVGAASGPHLHYEVAVPDTPGDDLTFSLGGFFQNGSNVVPLVCDIADNLYVDDESYTAAPCNHQPPTAEAGGPYTVDEGSAVQLDGTGSVDPDGNPLVYAWAPDGSLDDGALAQPTFAGIDDGFVLMSLTVYDQIEALDSTDFATVAVNNVAPTVGATGDVIDEAGTATVTATFSDPGTLDTHTATIDWGDGGGAHNVSPLQLGVGVQHVYGDNGTFEVTVTVTDDDGGVGSDTVEVEVDNLGPALDLDVGDAVAFPGGDYHVVEAGGDLEWGAGATDAGSDDLTFSWSTGDDNTYFNDGLGPDPLLSPDGVFPFAASDEAVAGYDAVGVESTTVTVSDDDGGTDGAAAGVIVTGTEDDTQGSGWWKHQYAGEGAPQVDDATVAGYTEIVGAASSVFSEAVSATTFEEVHAVLSPTTGDRRERATAALMVAWLQFASGAVAVDASVPLGGGAFVDFLDLMVGAEEAILDQATSEAELHAIEQDLARVRQAE